jgi:hypothetical protein
MFSRITAAMILFFSLGCAQPKYISEADSTSAGQQAAGVKAHCDIQFSSSKYCLSWFWENKPTSTAVGSLIFKIYRLNAFDQTAIQLDTQESPQLILWMPSMGHGSTPTVVQRLDVGTYRATEVFFIMPGEWDLKFQIKTGSEVTDEALVQIVL